MKQYGQVSERIELQYNLLIKRKLINAFIIYLLPLLIILFSMFIIFTIVHKKLSVLSSIGAYTGLFFALIILQRALRSQYPAAGLLYIEYFFFFTYIALLIFTANTALLHLKKKEGFFEKIFIPSLKMLFWPIILLAWFIVTILVFYN